MAQIENTGWRAEIDLSNLVTRNPTIFLVGLAVFICYVNALKPVHIDDTYYLWLARHIVSNPLDPFGFEILWQQWPMKAYDNYVPPVFPYWLALSMSLVGDNPFYLKLATLPFVLIFVFAVHELGKKIAPRLAMPLTFFLGLSPAILPSWNLMLDMPSIALGLAAIVAGGVAIDRQNWKIAIFAAAIASGAALVKFTALVIPGVILIYSIVHRRTLYGIGIGLLVLLVMLAWEYTHFVLYGHTQILWGVLQGNNSNTQGSAGDLAISAVMTIGGLFVFVGAIYGSVISDKLPVNQVATGTILIVFVAYVLGIQAGNLDALFLGSATFLVLVIALAGIASRKSLLSFDKIYLYLIGWLILEVAGYFLISPFPAARRIIGIGVVLTLLAFKLLHDRGEERHDEPIGQGIWLLVLGNFMLATLYFWVDFIEADAQKTIASDAVIQIREIDDRGNIWYVGHWGFAYYADKKGMIEVVPDSSILAAGDWLVAVDRVHSQIVHIDDTQMVLEGYLALDDKMPLRTVPLFYSGQRPLDKKLSNNRLRAYLYRSKGNHLLTSVEAAN